VLGDEIEVGDMLVALRCFDRCRRLPGRLIGQSRPTKQATPLMALDFAQGVAALWTSESGHVVYPKELRPLFPPQL
jgi:hypothetical protein